MSETLDDYYKRGTKKRRAKRLPFCNGEKESSTVKKPKITPSDSSTSLDDNNTKRKRVPWDEHYNMLKRYRKEHGHCRVSHGSKMVPGLTPWVSAQRAAYKQKKLSPDRIAKLNKLQFDWQVRERKSWEKRFEELQEFQREHGHTNVPQPYKANPKLGEWVYQQRLSYRLKSDKLMTTDRLTKLQAIRFNFDCDHVPRTPWHVRYDELVEYKKRFGDCNVPYKWKGNQQLSLWVKNQRQIYRRMQVGRSKSLTPERKEALDRLGFEWVAMPWRRKVDRNHEPDTARLDSINEQNPRPNKLKEVNGEELIASSYASVFTVRQWSAPIESSHSTGPANCFVHPWDRGYSFGGA